jgi:outer membrane protein OmpA-like peptidoglycan-associated protein
MRIVEACDLPWDMLRGRGQVRFCQSCGKEVHDLTSMTESEARAYLFLRGGRLCSRSPTDSEGTVLLPETRARRGGRALPLLAATLSATMTACSGPPVASEATASVAPSCQTMPDPSVVPRIIVSETMGVTVLEQVHFARESMKIVPESVAILDDIARVMKEHSEIEEVAVEGHASADEPNPRALSQERARQGVAWLVAAGIHPRRLVARGWGAEHPLDSTDTESGRQKNRRLEFLILTNRP